MVLTEGINADPRRGWPDAVSAAPLAAFTSRPVLLTRQGSLPSATAAAFAELGVDETLVVGGPAAVGDSVVAGLETAGHGPRRLAGADRYETSRAVYEEMLRAGMTEEVLWPCTCSVAPLR